jgi:hypothetical protein
MNGDQTARAFWGVLALIGMAIYPPWVSSYATIPANITSDKGLIVTSQLVHDSRDYSWIWEPPQSGNAIRIDLVRLSIQWLAVVALFGLWVYAGRATPGPTVELRPAAKDCATS